MRMQAINWKLTKISLSSWTRAILSKSVLLHTAQGRNHWHSAKARKPHVNFVISIVGKPPGNGPHRTKSAPGCIWTWSTAEAGILSCHPAHWKEWGLKYHTFGTQTICSHSTASRTSLALMLWTRKYYKWLMKKCKSLKPQRSTSYYNTWRS